MTLEVVESGASRIAVIRIVNPPINAVSLPIRQMVVTALTEVSRSNDISGAVLCGAGGMFATGIPLRELEDGPAAPVLGEVCQVIEMLDKPVVALLTGHVAAAGLEMALAAHARIAVAGAKLGLPDFRLGLSPGGGATQRLPRLIGAAGALEMMLEAQPHPAQAPLCQPLIDRFANGPSALEEAVAMAAEMAQSGGWVRTRDRTDGLLDPAGFRQAVLARRARLTTPPDQMTLRIIEAVEAAQLLPFEAGLAFEASCFDDLRQTPQSRGLRRARQSEQKANRLTSVTGPKVTDFAVTGSRQAMIRVGGAVLMNGGKLTIYSATPGEAEAVREDLWARSQPGLAARGPAALALAEAGLTATEDLADLAEVQALFTTMPATGEALTSQLTEVAAHLGPEAVVLCQTDRKDIPHFVPQALAGRVYGVALADRDFPARAAEVSVPEDAPQSAVAMAQSALWKLGRLTVRGTAGRPMMTPDLFDTMMAAADALARGGIAPSRIETALRDRGFLRSPYALLMQANAASYLSRTLNRRSRFGLSHRILTESIVPILDGKTSVVLDYAAADVVETGPLELSDTDIAGAMTAALANAGCRLIAEGAAFRPMQIDTIMLHGFGYPRGWGGPMAEADLTGLRVVLDRCKGLEALDAALWSPHPMLQDFYVNGLNFLDLDHSGQNALAA